MPIYEYSCLKCGARVEAMRKVSDKPLTTHAECGGKLEKEWSRTGFQFKGSGWYVTDYAARKSDPKADGDKAGGDVAKAEAAGETKEAKPDAKSDAAMPAKKTPKAKTPSKGAGAD
jgi:putative FmdB family regulatory protein